MSSLDFTFSLEDLSAAEAATTNPYLADPSRGLALVTRLIAHPSGAVAGTQREHMARFHQLIHGRFVNLAARDDLPGAVLAHRKLLALEASLQDLVSFPDLANKTIVGVGGGFSAGKSRFLNTVLGHPLLPEDTSPTTAIPTYLAQGASLHTVALNSFDHQVPLDSDALAAITHAFRKHYLQSLGNEVGFSHVLKLLMLRTPAFIWKNLALLDTPGYSKADAEGTHTDEKLALQQLSEADRLIWLMNAKNGSMRLDDLGFLRSLDHREPIFVVITQSDLVASSSIQSIMDSTRKALQDADIPCAGIMAWAAPLELERGQRLAGDDVLEWLSGLDQKKKMTTKRVECAKVLDAYIHHSGNALKNNQNSLSALNELLPFIADLPVIRQQAVRSQLDRCRNEQKRLRDLVSEFEKLKHELLAELGAIVGDVAQDQDLRNVHQLFKTLKVKELGGPVAVGTQFTATIKMVRSEIKRVILFTHDSGKVEFFLSFTQIREHLHLDPLTLVPGSVFAAEVVAVDDSEVILSITNPHALG